jgi:hypothetical protein
MAKIVEFRNPDNPWPDIPEIPALVIYEDEDLPNDFDPPEEEEIEEQSTLMLRRQRLFRWAAQAVAKPVSELPEVQKLAAFGAVAQPLKEEVPRFRRFRRYRIEVPHECADLDVAIWLTRLDRLKELKKALSRGLAFVQDTPFGGVAHHQLDTHFFEAGTGAYRGRLCIFGQCPKHGKRECRVPGCGSEPFLQQFHDYRFDPARFEAEPKVILFDRDTGFLVRPPRIEAKEPIWKRRKEFDEDEDFEEDENEQEPF